MQADCRYVLTTRGNTGLYGESVEVYLVAVSLNGAGPTYEREMADRFSMDEAMMWRDRLGSWWLRVQRVSASKYLARNLRLSRLYFPN